jgi:hypothetical protein
MVLVDLDHNRLETTEVLPEFPARHKGTTPSLNFVECKLTTCGRVTGELIERLMAHIHPALETIDLAFPVMSNNIELERTPGTFIAFRRTYVKV